MARTKLYTAIFVALMIMSTAQAMIEFQGLLDDMYWTAFAGIMAISTLKAGTVAAYYMHLRWEPRSVTYLMLGGLFVALALTAAAAYSIL